MGAKSVKNIAVVGSGHMGQGIAQVLASSGYAVCLQDVTEARLAKALECIAKDAALLEERNLLPAGQAGQVLGRIKATTSLQEAAAQADVVFEAVCEDLELKQDMLGQFERLSPRRALLVSTTSALSVNAIAHGASCPERVVVAHFWNPPTLIPLVEVVPNDKTSAKTINAIVSLLKACGKHPVVLKKDVPGFIGNRLQFALLREAMALVESGVATPEDVDTVVEMSFGRRLSVTGPLRSADLAGLDSFKAICNYLYKDLACDKSPQRILCDMVEKGHLGAKADQGFYRWTPEKVRKARRDRNAELLRWL